MSNSFISYEKSVLCSIQTFLSSGSLMLRLAWPAYTNEAIFLFHATALVFFSGFPAWQQKGDALYYASYFADKTFNPSSRTRPSRAISLC